MFTCEKITDNIDTVKIDVETRAPISPKFRKVDLGSIDEIKYLRDKLMYLIHVGERQSLPKQIIDVIGCESGYCVVINETLKIVGAVMNALQHGYYSCIVLRGDKISLMHAPCMRIDKDEILKPEDIEELEWSRDQLQFIKQNSDIIGFYFFRRPPITGTDYKPVTNLMFVMSINDKGCIRYLPELIMKRRQV